MTKAYQIVTRAERESAAVLEQFCKANGQILLPLMNLIENASQVVDTVIHEVGVQMLESILRTPRSALARDTEKGASSWLTVSWRSSARGFETRRPGKSRCPAYERLRNNPALSALLPGVSMREYQEGLQRMAPTGRVEELRQPACDRGKRREAQTAAGAALA